LKFDVAIVGGGPAGLATAIAASERGLSVVVCDSRTPPIDKGCGEGLMPDAVERLRSWRVEIPATERFPISGIRYLDGGTTAEASFPGSPAWGVRRTALHSALERRARESADLRWGVRVTGLEERRLNTDAGTIEAEWIVGADGLHSRVRRWVGLERQADPQTRALNEPERHGIRRHYALQPWTDRVEVYWADGAEAYVTPVAAGELGVAILWSGPAQRFGPLLERFPELRGRLTHHPPTTRDRGASALEQLPRRVATDRVALVGDAAGYVDAITGEGLAAAFHQADALGEALAAGNLRSYRRAHRRLSRFPVGLIRVLLFAERRPALRRRLVAALAADPELFQRLLAVHAGQTPLAALPRSTLLRLATGLTRRVATDAPGRR